MGGDGVPCRRKDDPLFFIQYHIKKKVCRTEGGGRFQVLPDRVAVQLPRPGPRLGHMAVIGPDGVPGADPGKDGFHAAAVPGEVVILDVAGADPESRPGHPGIYLHRCPGGGVPQQDISLRPGVGDGVPVKDSIPHKAPQFFQSVAAVAPQGRNDKDISVRHPAPL